MKPWPTLPSAKYHVGLTGPEDVGIGVPVGVGAGVLVPVGVGDGVGVGTASHPRSEVAGLWVGGVDGGKGLASCPCDVDNRACPFGQTGCIIDDTAGVVASNRQARTGRPVEGKLLARLVTVLLALQDQVDFLADQQIQ